METKRKYKKKTGYPPKEINWDIVDEYLEAGCMGTEIAGLLGMHEDTLYKRCQQEKGTTFSAYSQQKKSKGNSILRKTQYDEALAGDRGMLIWLGKQRLGQKDNPGPEGLEDAGLGILNKLLGIHIDGKSLDSQPKSEAS